LACGFVGERILGFSDDGGAPVTFGLHFPFKHIVWLKFKNSAIPFGIVALSDLDFGRVIDVLDLKGIFHFTGYVKNVV